MNKWRSLVGRRRSNRVSRNQVLKIYRIFDARPYDADISTILLVKFERRSSLPPLSKTPRIYLLVEIPCYDSRNKLTLYRIPTICNLDISLTFRGRQMWKIKMETGLLIDYSSNFWIVRLCGLFCYIKFFKLVTLI